MGDIPQTGVVGERPAARRVVTFTANPSIDRTVGLPGPLARGEVQRAESVTEQAAGIDAERRVLALSSAGPLAAEVGDSSARRGTPAQVAAQPTPAQVRRWAVSVGLAVSDRGRIRADVLEAYRRAHA